MSTPPPGPDHARDQNMPQSYSYSQPPYVHPIVVTGPPTSPWAVASLIFGIIGILGGWCLFGVPCFIAVICGWAGIRETNGGVKSGRGMAQAGLILGLIFVVPAIVLTVTGAVGSVFE